MYKLTNSTNILRSDGASIPADLANVDYAAYLAWVDAGNVPEPADPIPVVYAALTPRQIRQALTRANLRSEVEAAVVAGNQDLKDWWEYASEFERLHPQVVAMGAALGQTEQQLNDLWTLGASL